MTFGPESEIGRELKASELQPMTVVVVRREDHPELAHTLWVIHVSEDQIHLQANFDGSAEWNFLVQRKGDEARDGSGHRMYFFEFLGDYEGKITFTKQ
jgi:hypothetical protein